MDFEERLRRFDERHEALAQTVQLLADMHVQHERDYEDHSAKLDQRIGEIVEASTVLHASRKAASTVSIGSKMRVSHR